MLGTFCIPVLNESLEDVLLDCDSDRLEGLDTTLSCFDDEDDFMLCWLLRDFVNANGMPNFPPPFDDF